MASPSGTANLEIHNESAHSEAVTPTAPIEPPDSLTPRPQGNGGLLWASRVAVTTESVGLHPYTPIQQFPHLLRRGLNARTSQMGALDG
jgi:hypothetical protein